MERVRAEAYLGVNGKISGAGLEDSSSQRASPLGFVDKG